MTGEVPATGHWRLGYGRTLPYIDFAGGPTVGELDPSRWHQLGRCSQRPSAWWFSDPRSRKTRVARLLCAQCPVRQLCLASSLAFGDEFGTWGGLTADQRVPLLRRLRAGEALAKVLDDVLESTCGDQVA